MDKYSCFEHLCANETKGVDFEVRMRTASSGIAVISIHGGDIEPGTSEIAEAVAGADHTFYTLRGTKEAGNGDLHITSTLFDEPAALEIVHSSKAVISIHGCSEEEEIVHVGGLGSRLRECITEKLREAGFKTGLGALSLRGQDGRNICNRCARKMGVQLEISKGLRAAMFGGHPYVRALPRQTFNEFVEAVRIAIRNYELGITN